MNTEDDGFPGGGIGHEVTACGLVLTDPDGLIRRTNHTFCAWLGYEREQLVGKLRLQDLLTIGGKIFHQTHWLPLLKMQGSIAEVKLDLVHRDGRASPVVINAVSREHSGVAYHEVAVFVAEDRHRYERELMVARKRAEELLATHLASQEALALADARLRIAAEDRARFAEQMIGIVSHDLRNPLTAIKMGMNILGTEELPAAKRDRIAGHIDASVDRARRLVDDLLDFTQAKIGAGLSVSLRQVDLHEIVADAVSELRLAFPGRTFVHVQHGDGDAQADADRIAQLLGNLAANAVAYGAVDTPVTVTSRTAAGTFSLDVHNAGTPIPPEMLPVIFEPMTRGTVAGTSLRSVGLGLFIVREIVHAHGGQIAATSSSSDGTSFLATFPGR